MIDPYNRDTYYPDHAVSLETHVRFAVIRAQVARDHVTQLKVPLPDNLPSEIDFWRMSEVAKNIRRPIP